MSEIATAGGPAARHGRTGGAAPAAGTWAAPDTRRTLQLALGAAWLLDAVLQYQSFMFTKAFGQMLAATAPGNPSAVASPISWNARLIEHHGVVLNTAFATVQLLLALGIAWRPTVRPALAASVAWAVGVWWLGEGMGGILTGNASPVTGAPGAVILYALLAVLLWPGDRGGESAPFGAARAVGARAARALWLVLWASLAYFALLPGNRAPQALRDMITSMAAGEPGWLAGRPRQERGRARRPPGPGRLDRAGHRVRPDRRRRLPAAAGCPGHPRPGHRGGRHHLGRRGGARDHPHRCRHRSQLRAAAGPARAGLLAGRRPELGQGGPADHRPASPRTHERTVTWPDPPGCPASWPRS